MKLMSKGRIKNHPVLGNLGDRRKVSFIFDGKKFEGLEGDTIASALLANGVRQLRVQEASGTGRGIYCNIGHCFECRVSVNGQAGVRACLTLITDNMVVDSGEVLPSPLSPEVEVLPKTYSEYEEIYKKGGK